MNRLRDHIFDQPTNGQDARATHFSAPDEIVKPVDDLTVASITDTAGADALMRSPEPGLNRRAHRLGGLLSIQHPEWREEWRRHGWGWDLAFGLIVAAIFLIMTFGLWWAR